MSEDITPATDETIVALARLAEHDIPIASGDVFALIARVRQAESGLAWAARILRDADYDGGYLDGKEARHWLAAHGAGEDA